MTRGVSTRKIVIDGNSIPQRANSGFITAFNAIWGSSNYDMVNIAVGGQNTDDVLTRLPKYAFAESLAYGEMIYVLHEIRNQIKDGTTPADELTKIQNVFSQIKALNTNILTVCVLTSASLTTSGDAGSALLTDIPICNGLIAAESSGYIDLKIDLYNYSTFDDPFSSVFSDYVHYSSSGITQYTNYIANEINDNLL